MLKLRTKLLLLAIAVFGIGIGVLFPFTDGAYSALCLFVLPLFVALAALSILADFNAPHAVKMDSIILEGANSIESPQIARACDEEVQVSRSSTAFSLSLRDDHVTFSTKAAPLQGRSLSRNDEA